MSSFQNKLVYSRTVGFLPSTKTVGLLLTLFTFSSIGIIGYWKSADSRVIGFYSVLPGRLTDSYTRSNITSGSDLSIERDETHVLCWVPSVSQDRARAVALKDTWGKRCDKLVFISDVEDKSLGSVKIGGVEEGELFLWGKTREALKYLYDNYLDEFEWFLKADTDTYVIMENLRYVLAPYDPDFPIALGERFIENGNRDRSYLGGGSGYVLSRGALRVYGEVAYENETLCQKEPVGPEDVTLGVCMTSSGILLGDTRDQFGKHRFHQNIPGDYIEGKWQSWYPNVTLYESGKGIESLSETSVSFHNLKSDSDLYVLEYFIYILKLFNVEGRFTGPSVAPLPPDVDSAPEEARRRRFSTRKKENRD